MKIDYVGVCAEVARGVSPSSRVKIQFMGGITARALSDPSLRVYPEDRVMEASPELRMPTTRENGTLRDLDILALTTDPSCVTAVQDEVSGIVDGRLDVSVFGIRPAEILRNQSRHPMGMSALKTFLSDRYREETGETYRALFPFSVPIDNETIEPWRLVIGQDEIPMPAPAATVLNYTQRSISGLRAKDKKKWLEMVNNLKSTYPKMQDDILEGSFAEQAQLTMLIEGLRGGDSLVSETLGLRRLSFEELSKSPFLMLNGQPERNVLRAVKLARSKARGLAFFESNETVVGLWQQHVERRLDTVVKNQ